MFTGDINKKLLRKLKATLKAFEDDLAAASNADAAAQAAREAKQKEADAARAAHQKKQREAIAARAAHQAKQKEAAAAKAAHQAKPDDAGAKAAHEARQKEADAARAAHEARQKEAADAKAAHEARQKEAAPSDPNQRWLLYKISIARRLVTSALQSRAPLEQTRIDLDVVIKEISARFASVNKDAPNQDKLSAARKDLCEAINNLSLLCLSRDAASPQLGLLTIYFASQEAAERLTSACKILDCWKRHWNGACGLTDFGRLHDLVCGSADDATKQEPGMQARLVEVERVALEAATTCDPETIRQSCDAVCKELTGLHDDYTEAVCLLQRLKCAPEMEPTFLDQVSRYLDRAIYYVAVAFQAVRTVCVTEKTWTEQLVQAWGDLGNQVPGLAAEVARAARKNLCGPADLCRDQLNWLSRYAEQGLNAARQLQSDPGSAAALAQANDVLGKFQGQLLEFNGKKLPRRALDAFSRPLALISRVQSGCPEEEDCCLLTESQLEQLLDKLRKTLAGTGCEHLITRLTTPARQPILGRRSNAPPVSAPAPAQQSLPAGDDGLRQLPLYLELLPAFEKAASRVVDYVPESLKPRIRDIASRALEQARQLKAEQKAGTLAGSLLAQRLGLQLNENLMVLTAAYVVAQDTAPAAVKATLAEVGQQLNSITQRLTGAPGPQPAARELACCAGGGNAS
jgi:hypothetical protein